MKKLKMNLVKLKKDIGELESIPFTEDNFKIINKKAQAIKMFIFYRIGEGKDTRSTFMEIPEMFSLKPVDFLVYLEFINHSIKLYKFLGEHRELPKKLSFENEEIIINSILEFIQCKTIKEALEGNQKNIIVKALKNVLKNYVDLLLIYRQQYNLEKINIDNFTIEDITKIFFSLKDKIPNYKRRGPPNRKRKIDSVEGDVESNSRESKKAKLSKQASLSYNSEEDVEEKSKDEVNNINNTNNTNKAFTLYDSIDIEYSDNMHIDEEVIIDNENDNSLVVSKENSNIYSVEPPTYTNENLIDANLIANSIRDLVSGSKRIFKNMELFIRREYSSLKSKLLETIQIGNHKEKINDLLKRIKIISDNQSRDLELLQGVNKGLNTEVTEALKQSVENQIKITSEIYNNKLLEEKTSLEREKMSLEDKGSNYFRERIKLEEKEKKAVNEILEEKEKHINNTNNLFVDRKNNKNSNQVNFIDFFA